MVIMGELSSPVQCLASAIAGLLQDHQARLKTPKASQLTLGSYFCILPQHISAALRQWSQKKKWRLLWTLTLGTPHIGTNIIVTLSLVPITMHLPPSLQVSQSATQCMMTQNAQVRATLPTICDVW